MVNLWHYHIPIGFDVIANRTVLMLIKADSGYNPPVYAACGLHEGVQELLRRFYNPISSKCEVANG